MPLNETKAPTPLEEVDVEAGVVDLLEVMIAVGIIEAPAPPEVLERGPAANETTAGEGWRADAAAGVGGAGVTGAASDGTRADGTHFPGPVGGCQGAGAV